LEVYLHGVIGDNFLKQNSQYRIIYDERMKKTKVIHPEWHNLNPDGSKNTGKNMNPKHAYRDAIRVMMKRFLAEFWCAGYAAKGLEAPRKAYILTFPQHHEEPNIQSFKVGESHILSETQPRNASSTTSKHPSNQQVITKSMPRLNPLPQCEPLLL